MDGDAWDLAQELSEIPPEYQDVFRRTLNQELAELGPDRSDSDILRYLRRRQEEMQRGSFIRPDGRPGLLALSPEALYEQALPELVQSALGEETDPAGRRQVLLKVGGLALVALLFLVFVLRGRAQRAAAQEAAETPVTTVDPAGTAAPTPPLPEISGADDTLQTIGGLGGALTIGRPSALTLHYGRTEETIALAIDPSKPTTRGELRFSEATMLSENPVAVWLFGTVLNYAIGIPDSLIRNLQPGDRLTLATDTGAALSFVVSETGTAASHEAGRLLSQNRLGLTLFALPAVAEDAVAIAFAGYDMGGEEAPVPATLGVGEPFLLGAAGEMAVSAVDFSHTAVGEVQVTLQGRMASPAGGTANPTGGAAAPAGSGVLLSLATGNQQSPATALDVAADGSWQVVLMLPAGSEGLPLVAEFRALPQGALALVQLGMVPRLQEQLQVELQEAWWDAGQAQAVLVIAVGNPTEGAIYLGEDFVQFPATPEGGDAYVATGQVTPRLPLLLEAGETVGLTLSALPHVASMRLQIGADLWEVAGMPLAVPGQ